MTPPATTSVDPTPGLLRVDAWQSTFPWLRAGFSVRQGGRTDVYGAPGEQNLGWTAEDPPAIVAANRLAYTLALTGGVALPLVTVSQVHSARIRNLQHEPQPWMTSDGKARMEGDGLLSLEPGRLLSILTADCVPVLLADTRTHAVGAFHAGWRGTLARIVQAGVVEMTQSFGSRPEDLAAAIGPSIRACCFEVGPEVQSAFEAEFGARPGGKTEGLFSAGGDSGSHVHLDLAEANRRQLLEAGMRPEAIHVLERCTACAVTASGQRQFFSYRAEQGRTGRMLSGIAALW